MLFKRRLGAGNFRSRGPSGFVCCARRGRIVECSFIDTPVALLPRDALLPVSVVAQYFPDVTKEAGTGPNETRVGEPIASRSVVYTSPDGKKTVTLSIDRYASASAAASAYQIAVQGSKAAPGFRQAASPDLGEEAFAGSSQQGAEKHFGIGARDGALILSATHAGDIPVTPGNSAKLIELGRAELATAKQRHRAVSMGLGPSQLPRRSG